ncbi:helix-turn-helix transcriptional regulator [Roseivirga pacifica]|uniref:helix-turn-helix transcriptional regulator n=1 Tax=Roseivirga pacifica TaxID=1267423 RepID=UPI002094F6DC|nr:YafY family protein [Roseivirga pacifica]MCO6359719.1 WYL domain-containing protein [Roseivirga pacifica]MCO6367089.1 WYL domain-containing protein [Roseivirga pacifica]MCO6370379.1 WYL domain-containing protein [Roseivirga pacifica]MCO6374746.1 WYL domain-containing protein [Roseivirga pacifica]MCO6380004.1 WYL domain-containing protein [Roseivirga pacifica]
MNRIDRLTAILVQLQSKKVVKAHEIADRFEISLRTVYRDVRALEEAGIPIGAEAGVGYFIMDGYHLPPVMFTQEEANALVLGAKLIEGQTDQSIKKHFSEAMLKIKSVLKSNQQEDLEKLEEQILVNHPPIQVDEKFPNNFIATIQKSLVESKVLQFKYYSNYNGNMTERQVEPMGLVHYGQSWHLLAYCRLRKEPRDFRVDRLVKLEMLEERFTPQSPYEQFIKQLTWGGELEEAIIEIKGEAARYIVNQKYYQGFVSEVDKGATREMTFLVPHLTYFSHWLCSLGSMVKIVSPPKLKDLMKERVEELKRSYE